MQGQHLDRMIVQLLWRHRGERHVIALQDYPDPDAIGSAMAHRHLSHAFQIQADIVFAGEISHHQNQSLVGLLRVDLHHVRDGYPLAAADGAVFVDNQGATCPYLVRLLERADVPTVLIMDHHEGETHLHPELHIQETVGATSTLYAEFFRRGDLSLDPTSPDGRLLATALLQGILTDTQRLASATPRDLQAAAWLTPLRDAAMLDQVAQERMPFETEEVLARASTNRVLRRGFHFAGVGYLKARHRDALPQAAAWLLTQGDVHTSIVFGIVRDWRLQETLAGSLRTVLPSPSPHDFLRKALGPDAGREIGRGGRPFAGGFEIPIGMSTRASSPEFQMARWAYYEQLILGRLNRAAEWLPLHSPRPPVLPAGRESRDVEGA
jgi:nanoRNase/pAp phosphatase (c-di-AMP/oligoRNAs hydrolase)